jgi:hypothetical protein
MEHFISNVRGDSEIRKEYVPAASFHSGSGNLFPKWPNDLYQDNLELWNFDGIALDGSAAIVISFTRDAMDAPGGLRLLVLASWQDEVWCKKLIFSASSVTIYGKDTAAGQTSGVWRSDDGSGEARFEIDTEITDLHVSLNVPGKVIGTLKLKASPGFDCLPRKAEDAEMASTLFNTRPVAHADAFADLSFVMDESKTERRLQLGSQQQAVGGLERLWSPLSFNKIVSEYLYVRAQAGPYCILAMQMIDKPERNNEISVSARLYYDGELVCAPQNKVSSNNNGDTLIVEKLSSQSPISQSGSICSDQGIRGAFRDSTIAHRLEFRSGATGGRTWSFELRHQRRWWSIPTSAPGPDATGLSGFIDSVVGGQVGTDQRYNGVGRSGQAQMH